jgi:hypothetical protein
LALLGGIGEKDSALSLDACRLRGLTAARPLEKKAAVNMGDWLCECGKNYEGNIARHARVRIPTYV